LFIDSLFENPSLTEDVPAVDVFAVLICFKELPVDLGEMIR
jgi:hypothetical protein